MSFVPIATVTALVKVNIGSSDMQAVIDREEAILAGEVGALTGSRVETFTITDRTASWPIRVRRPATSVAVTESNTATTDIRLGADGRTIRRLTASGWRTQPWAGVVEATYSPADGPKVTSWVIELVRARLTEGGHFDIEGGDDGYDRRPLSHEAVLDQAIADILGRNVRGTGSRRRGLTSVRLSQGPASRPWVGSVRP